MNSQVFNCQSRGFHSSSTLLMVIFVGSRILLRLKILYSLLSAFKQIYNFLNQVHILSVDFWCSLMESSRFSFEDSGIVGVYSNGGMSRTKIFNRRGPSMLACGTPAFIFLPVDKMPFLRCATVSTEISIYIFLNWNAYCINTGCTYLKIFFKHVYSIQYTH